MSAIEELDGARLRRVVETESGRGVVVDFWSPWCAPCRVMRPHLARLAEERDEWRFLAVNTEAHPAVADDFDVQALPTLVFYQAGREVHRLAGKALISTVAETLDALGPS